MPSSTSASGAYCNRTAAASTARRAASHTVRVRSAAGWMQSASKAISTAAATNSVMGLCAKPTSSYQNAPATSAARAAASLKCRRAKKYIPAGMAREIAQNTSSTPPTYQNGSPSPARSKSFSVPATRPGTSHERAP